MDGHEVVFATNALGHYALAGELLTALAEASGRMVWLGSMSTSLTPYDPVDPQLTDRYTAWRAYVQSKVATAALGFEADRRLRAADIGVASVVAHPGYSTGGRTPGIVGVNEPSRAKRFRDNLQAAIAQSKERGAWSLVRALVDPEIEGGEFWGPRTGSRGEPRRQTAAKITRDPDVAARLWDFAETATGVHWPFEAAARWRGSVDPRSPRLAVRTACLTVRVAAAAVACSMFVPKAHVPRRRSRSARRVGRQRRSDTMTGADAAPGRTARQALSHTASAAARGSETAEPSITRAAASVTVTVAPTATPADSTARSSSGSRSLTRSTRPT